MIEVATFPQLDLFIEQLVVSAGVGYLAGVIFRANPYITAAILSVQLIGEYVFFGIARLFTRCEGKDLTFHKIVVFSSSFVCGAAALALYEFRVIGIFLFTLFEIFMVFNALKRISYVEQNEKSF
jgi:uncharacterized membrane protein HdeD (DUF308 family)